MEQYLALAAALRGELEAIDGFLSVERFQSMSVPNRMVSLSFFRDEQAVQQWRNTHPIGLRKLEDVRVFSQLQASCRQRRPRLWHGGSRRGPDRQPCRSFQPRPAGLKGRHAYRRIWPVSRARQFVLSIRRPPGNRVSVYLGPFYVMAPTPRATPAASLATSASCRLRPRSAAHNRTAWQRHSFAPLNATMSG